MKCLSNQIDVAAREKWFQLSLAAVKKIFWFFCWFLFHSNDMQKCQRKHPIFVVFCFCACGRRCMHICQPMINSSKANYIRIDRIVKRNHLNFAIFSRHFVYWISDIENDRKSFCWPIDKFVETHRNRREKIVTILRTHKEFINLMTNHLVNGVSNGFQWMAATNKDEIEGIENVIFVMRSHETDKMKLLTVQCNLLCVANTQQNSQTQIICELINHRLAWQTFSSYLTLKIWSSIYEFFFSSLIWTIFAAVGEKKMTCNFIECDRNGHKSVVE